MRRKGRWIQGSYSVLLLSWGVRQGTGSCWSVVGEAFCHRRQVGWTTVTTHLTSFSLLSHWAVSLAGLWDGRSDFRPTTAVKETRTFRLMHTFVTLTTWGEEKATKYHVSMSTAKVLVFTEKKYIISVAKTFHDSTPTLKAPSHHRKCADQWGQIKGVPGESGPHSCTAQQDLSHETSPPDFPGSLLPHHVLCGR